MAAIRGPLVSVCSSTAVRCLLWYYFGATYYGATYYGATDYGSLLVVVVYRHGEHAGTLWLLTSVEARHVRVLERLLDVGHIVSRSMVNIQQDTGIAIDMAIGIGIGIGIATGSRVGMPARRRAVLTMAVLSMPLLTTYEPARRRASYRG